MKNSDMNYLLPKYEDYQDCMVAFVDVLGFDSKVRSIKSESDFKEVRGLLFALKKNAEAFNQNKDLFKNLTITAISDSIIITMPYSDPYCAFKMVVFIKKLQYELVALGYETLLRGYITRGKVYHKDQILFGEGYSEAYRKESEIGGAPRIVVDPRIIEDGREKISNYKNNEEIDHIFNHLVEDKCDGNYFIDYLNPSGFSAVMPKDQLIEERKKINVFIKKCLESYKDDRSIYSKYRWLDNYFSSTEHYFEKS